MTAPLTIGLELGGTQVRAALFEGGTILRHAKALTDVAGGPLAVMVQFERLIAQVCVGSEADAVRHVGISSPGPVDTTEGIVLGISTLPGWENFPLRDVLQKRLGRPVVVENDAISAANGEWKFGAGKGQRHLVFITVSTGIGGGVVVDGHLLHGRRGMAAHVGHFRMRADEPRCTCGMIGCFEALAAGPALGLRGQRAAERDPKGHLGQVARHETVTARHVADGARAGDEACKALMRDEAQLLGQGFTSLIHLYSPELLIMGGGVSKAYDLMRDDIHAVIRQDAMAPFKDVRVVPAQLGDMAGLVGVANLAGGEG